MGLVIGLVVGVGGTYLVLRPPWAKHDTAPAETEQVAEAPTGDAGVGKPKKKRHGGGGHRPAGAGGVNAASPDGRPVEVTSLRELVTTGLFDKVPNEVQGYMNQTSMGHGREWLRQEAERLKKSTQSKH